MKKASKIIGIIIVTLVVVVIVLLFIVSRKQLAPDSYCSNVETGGEIEAKYLKMGSYEVAYKDYPLFQNFKKFSIYYPSELESTEKKYPVVVICNGSGLPASKYTNLFKHLSSWGFIVIGTEETYAWNGFGAEMSVRFLSDIDKKETLGENNEKNILYHKIDFDNVGITGHSQGGVGVFNAISAQEHGNIYKTAVSLSPTKSELAENLYWHYDVSDITTPMLLFAGTDEADFIDPESLKEIYNSFPVESFKVMATRNNIVHNEMLYYADGYVTAWFMWYLQGDEKAAIAFCGEDAEILRNPFYQNQYINQ